MSLPVELTTDSVSSVWPKSQLRTETLAASMAVTAERPQLIKYDEERLPQLRLNVAVPYDWQWSNIQNLMETRGGG